MPERPDAGFFGETDWRRNHRVMYHGFFDSLFTAHFKNSGIGRLGFRSSGSNRNRHEGSSTRRLAG
jgi:hypothetical protein